MCDVVDAVEAKAVFASLDADGDGSLSSQELANRLSDFGLGDEEISMLFVQLDTNGDGKIDADEWLAGYGRYQSVTAGDDSAPLSRTMSRTLENDILEALAEARAQPSVVAERVKLRRGWLKGKEMTRPGRDVPVMTKEGKGAVEDALAFLAKQPPLPGFSPEPVEGLALASADHVADIGGVGEASHAGSDGSTSSERQRRYGNWQGKCGECLWYGKTGQWLSGRDMIDDLIVDDGVDTRGHRLCIYDDKYTCAGVSVGSHAVYSNMACVEFALGYEPDTAAIAARQAAGPPVIEGSDKGPSSKAFHKIGGCVGCGEQIRGGTVIEIPGLGKFHGDCFCCAGCKKNLAGVKQKKQEKKQIFCQACWVKDFAEKCAECGKGIEGGKTKAGGKVYHPDCWKKVKAAGGNKKPAAGGPMGGAMGGGPTKGKTKKVKKKKPKSMVDGAGGMADMYAGLE